MKRELDKLEKDKTQEGIKVQKLEIKEAEEAIEIINKQKKYIASKREFEDGTREYNRKKQDKELEDTLKGAKQAVQMAKEKIKVLESHLKDGVEVKKATGVA